MSHHAGDHQPPTPRQRRFLGGRLGFFGVALGCFGLLIWARLLLITGHPKTAIADPATETPPKTKPPTNAAKPVAQDMPKSE